MLYLLIKIKKLYTSVEKNTKAKFVFLLCCKLIFFYKITYKLMNNFNNEHEKC